MSDETRSARWSRLRIRRWRIDVVEGASRGAWLACSDGEVIVGTAESCDLVVNDVLVSRRHLALWVEPGALRLRDLGSKNGTFLGGARVSQAQVSPHGAVVAIGGTRLALSPFDDELAIGPSASTSCHELVGQGPAMRGLFAQIERVAPTTATVLLHGETGTGKELVAKAVHHTSRRRDRPFVVLDCAALSPELVESELFGHVRGAFTGAHADRIGAFERADGGTLFLDEIGELPLEQQPKLLRVLETGQVRPVGGSRPRTVDVRIVAATHRDLRREAAEGRLRSDLYFRLAVVVLDVPALRDRPEDIPLLATTLAARRGLPELAAVSLERLAAAAWPGNVRQLANVLESVAALGGEGPLVIPTSALTFAERTSEEPAGPYKAAKEAVVAKFTREYVESLFRRHAGNASAAAREALLDRNWLVALAKRYGVPTRE